MTNTGKKTLERTLVRDSTEEILKRISEYGDRINLYTQKVIHEEVTRNVSKLLVEAMEVISKNRIHEYLLESRETNLSPKEELEIIFKKILKNYDKSSIEVYKDSKGREQTKITYDGKGNPLGISINKYDSKNRVKETKYFKINSDPLVRKYSGEEAIDSDGKKIKFTF